MEKLVHLLKCPAHFFSLQFPSWYSNRKRQKEILFSPAGDGLGVWYRIVWKTENLYLTIESLSIYQKKTRGLLCFYQTLIMVLKDWMVWRNRVGRNIIVSYVLFGPLQKRIFSTGEVILNMHGMCSSKIICMNVFQRLKQLHPKVYSVFRYILNNFNGLLLKI